jgi:hypothetical protein
MVKDSKRFSDSGGWGYGEFEYDAPFSRSTPKGDPGAYAAAFNALFRASLLHQGSLPADAALFYV